LLLVVEKKLDSARRRINIRDKYENNNRLFIFLEEGKPLLLMRRYLTGSTTALDVKGEQLVGRYGRDWP